MRYNRRHIEKTIEAAQKIANETQEKRYVYATALGFTIQTSPPPFHQLHYAITPQAKPELAGKQY